MQGGACENGPMRLRHRGRRSEARQGPIFGDGGFREGKGVFGDAIDPQSNLSAQGGAAGQGRQQQSAPKIKVLDKNGKTKIEYQAKPGEFGVQFK